MATSEPESRWAPNLPHLAPAGFLPDGSGRFAERLVLFLPILLLPHVGTPADLLQVGCLLAAVLAIDLGLGLELPRAGRAEGFVPTALGLAIGIGIGFAVGQGALWPLLLYAALAMLERTAEGERGWLARLGLHALAAALLVDLAVVALGLERSLDWLALGGGIGLASAAAEALAATTAGKGMEGVAPNESIESGLETALAIGLVVAIGAHAGLLAGEPALALLARSGSFLVLPFFALGLLRLGWLALDRRQGPDGLAVASLIAWALAASLLLEP